MIRLRRMLLCLSLPVLVSCQIEDHTPTGSRRDEETVQAIVTRYARTLSDRDWSAARRLFWADATYSGPMLPGDTDGHRALPIDLALTLLARRLEGLEAGRFDIRVLRADYRQEADLAAVWLVTRRVLPVAGSVQDREWIEHLVLRRIAGDWRILSLAATPSRRGGARAQR